SMRRMGGVLRSALVAGDSSMRHGRLRGWQANARAWHRAVGGSNERGKVGHQWCLHIRAPDVTGDLLGGKRCYNSAPVLEYERWRYRDRTDPRALPVRRNQDMAGWSWKASQTACAAR